MNFNLLFKTQVTFAVRSKPYGGIALGDLNHDGYLDIVTGTNRSISVLINDGKSGFAPYQTFSAGNEWTIGISLGDVNQDGHLDIVNTAFLLLGYGNGSFAPYQAFVKRSRSAGKKTVLGDVNQDGHLDIVTSDWNNQTVSLFLGYGNGSFATGKTFSTGDAWASGIALGDVNQDGYLDIVSGNSMSLINNDYNSVLVFLGDGKGSFTPYRAFAKSSGVIALGDLNHDGYLDIVSSNFIGDTISVLLGDGKGSFIPYQQFESGSGSVNGGIALGDVNQDGHLDVVSINSSDNTVSVLLGDGKGGFAPHQTFVVGKYPLDIALGDVNQDGHLDVVVSNSDDTTVSVLLGTPTPTLSSTPTRIPTTTFSPSLSSIQISSPTPTLSPSLSSTRISSPTPTFSQSVSLTQTFFPYSILLPSNHVFYPKGKISLIVTFNPTQDKIDLSLYPNVTYPSLQIRQAGNNSLIEFVHPALFQFNVHSRLSQSLTKDDFVFTASSTHHQPWLVQSASLLIEPVNNTDIFNFSTDQNKIDLRIYNVSYPAILMQSNGNMTFIQFNYMEQSQIIVNHTKASALNETTFIFAPLPTPLPTHSERLIDLKKAILLPIAGVAAIATLIGGYAKRDLLKKIFCASHCWTKDPHIKEEVWTPDNRREMHELTEITSTYTAFEPQDKSIIKMDTKSEPSRQTAYSYHARIEWSNPFLQDPQWLQIAYRSAGIQGIDRLLEIGADSNRYAAFQGLQQAIGTQEAVETLLLSDRPMITPPTPPFGSIQHHHLFWMGMVAYRLPAAYDQMQYLLKTAGFDLQTFYETQGIDPWVNDRVNEVGQVLRPSLFLGGATVAYCTSSDPLVLLVAANQPGFSGDSDPLSDGIYYLTAILSFARAYAHPSPYTLPLVTLQGTHLLSRVLVDTGYVAEDNNLLKLMQSATGMASEALGLILQPDLPIKVLQGISVLTQSIHCADWAWEHISLYLPYAEEAEETISDANQSEIVELQGDVVFV